MGQGVVPDVVSGPAQNFGDLRGCREQCGTDFFPVAGAHLREHLVPEVVTQGRVAVTSAVQEVESGEHRGRGAYGQHVAHADPP